MGGGVSWVEEQGCGSLRAWGARRGRRERGPSLCPPGLCDPPSRIHGAGAGPCTQSSQTADSRQPNAPRLLLGREEAGRASRGRRPLDQAWWRSRVCQEEEYTLGSGARGAGPTLAARVSGRKLRAPYRLRCKAGGRAAAGPQLASPGVHTASPGHTGGRSGSPWAQEATLRPDPDCRAAMDRGPCATRRRQVPLRGSREFSPGPAGPSAGEGTEHREGR